MSSEKTDPAPAPHTPIIYEEEISTLKYKHIERNLKDQESLTEKELNELATDNWELVTAFTHQSNAHYYFKRLDDE